ncbi:MAG: hypothetical protein M0Q88_04445 [Bacilli bacterium]|nr:hypothetical protein [Bacilli bacterium]
MRNKAKVIRLFIMFTFSLITLITVTFAWFIAIDKTDPIIIKSGTLKVSASLYIGLDTDEDGNVEESEYSIVEEPINLTNVLPGNIYYFKLEIENLGSVPGHLSVDAINIIYSDDIMKNTFKFDFVNPKSSEEETLFIFDEEINLFEDFVIYKESSLQFYFRIIGDEIINTDMQGHSLKLSSFLITLDQIQG